MAKKIVDVEARTVTFDFGEAGAEVFDLSKCSDAMVLRLALHGISQKGGDSYAGAKKATEELDATPDEWARAEVAAVIAQVYDDDWTIRTPGAGGTVTDLARALAEVLEGEGVTLEDAVTRLADASKEEKAELRKHPDIAAVLTRLKAERAAAKAEDAAAKAGSGPDLSAFMG